MDNPRAYRLRFNTNNTREEALFKGKEEQVLLEVVTVSSSTRVKTCDGMLLHPTTY